MALGFVMKNRIREMREARGWTIEQLAKKMKTSGQQVQRKETGERGVTLEWLQRFAKALGCEPWELMGGDSLKPVNTLQMRVIGFVQAGNWQEATLWPEDKQYQITIDGTSLPQKGVFALENRGDSMNLFYAEGTILICQNPYELSDPIKNGDHVIVQRYCKNSLVEATVKELKVIDGKAMLMPRSTNNEYLPTVIPWPYLGGPTPDAERIEIVGVVLQAHTIKRIRA